LTSSSEELKSLLPFTAKLSYPSNRSAECPASIQEERS
jgi:hypothetical protein